MPFEAEVVKTTTRRAAMRRKNPAAVALGRLGGRVSSPAKAAASRANGAKGGRPKKALARTKGSR